MPSACALSAPRSSTVMLSMPAIRSANMATNGFCAAGVPMNFRICSSVARRMKRGGIIRFAARRSASAIASSIRRRTWPSRAT